MTKVDLSYYSEDEDGNNMAKYKTMRAIDVVAKLIDGRPDEETYEAFSRRVGLPSTLSVNSLYERNDINTGLLYQIAKAFGYQIMIYNPNPPDGLEKCYIVGDKRCKVKPRERKRKMHYSRDTYNNEIYRQKRKYERKKFVKVA